MAVYQCLAVVIVLLFLNAERGEHDGGIILRVYIGNTLSGGHCKAEVVGDDLESLRAIATVGVVDRCEDAGVF